MGRDPDAAVANIVARVRDAGFQYQNAMLCRSRLTEAFFSYVKHEISSPLLQALAGRERAMVRILGLLTQRGSVPPILLALFLGFLRKNGAPGATVVPSPRHAIPRARVGTWSTAEEPKLSRPERHEALALRLKGYSVSAVAAIKGISPNSVVYRVVVSGCVADVKQARFALLRRTARKAWTAACRQHGHATMSTVARAEPRAYMWLWRHDREWLISRHVDACSAGRVISAFRLPEQQAQIAENLRDAMATLVEAGCGLPLNYCKVLREAGIQRVAFRVWMLADERFAHAMRPFFHPQGIDAPKSLRDRFLALDGTDIRPTRTGGTS
jgi:hypothetical protein